VGGAAVTHINEFNGVGGTSYYAVADDGRETRTFPFKWMARFAAFLNRWVAR
jgi:hypothetical protein